MSESEIIAEPEVLLDDIKQLVDSARQRSAAAVNTELTLLYWNIGHRIRQDVLKEERAEYGAQIVQTLSAQLNAEYGRGYGRRNLFSMMRFAEVFPDVQIVQSAIGQLSWSHFNQIISMQDVLKREFYVQMCQVERWSVRTLQGRIDSMLFERTALSRKPDELIVSELEALRDTQRMSPSLVLRDPYILDFLDLKDTYHEEDLEAAIIREMEAFLLELGAGFSFIARQKRIQLDGEDFYLDLLFYNRKLKRLVAIELKVGAFKAAYKGQMELYLRWIDKFEREPDELPPLGIILCTGKKAEQIELLELDKAGIHVAEYLTELPSRELLAERLHIAASRARQQIEQRANKDGIHDLESAQD